MSSNAPSPFPPSLLNTVFAPMLISYFTATALWAAGTVQMYYYYSVYINDSPYLKWLVASVWLLDTLHQALLWQQAWLVFVQHFGNPLISWNVEQSLISLSAALVSYLVQCFFITRVWRLSGKKKILTGALTALMTAALVVQVVFAFKTIKFVTAAQIISAADFAKSSSIIAAVGDVVIAVILVYYLRNTRTGEMHWDNVVERLILFTVNTTLLTSVSALLTFIIFALFPTKFFHLPFYHATSRLYTNSLLVALNARQSLRNRSGVTTLTTSNGNGAETQSDVSAEKRSPRIIRSPILRSPQLKAIPDEPSVIVICGAPASPGGQVFTERYV